MKSSGATNPESTETEKEVEPHLIWEGLDKKLILTGCAADTKEDVFRKVGGLLIREGYCRGSYVQALIDREKQYPTGLDIKGVGVAIPHTDASHVIRSAMAVAVLNNPVTFELMGGEEGETVAVSVVVTMAIRNAAEHLDQVKALLKILQDNSVLRELTSAKSPEEVISIFRRKEEAV